jgi:4-hydroxy-2-oxoheptanedioate aldolase
MAKQRPTPASPSRSEAKQRPNPASPSRSEAKQVPNSASPSPTQAKRRRSQASPSTADPTRLGRSFRRRLRRGDLLLGGMVLEYLRPSLVKAYVRAGFDFIFLEKEHGILDSHELPDFVQCARDNGIPVISKVGELNRSEVARLLDAGVTGIQLPRTESRDDLLGLVDLAKFPPLGTRAGAPCYGNVDYAAPADDRAWLRRANESTLVVAHIETRLGYDNAEEIITTPRLDMVYVGPYDFSIAMDRPGEYDHPDVRQPMEEILALCKQHGVPFGTTASDPNAARRWMDAGCQFFEAVDELALLAEGATRAVAAYR